MTTTSCGDSSGVLRCCRMNDGAVVLGSFSQAFDNVALAVSPVTSDDFVTLEDFSSQPFPPFQGSKLLSLAIPHLYSGTSSTCGSLPCYCVIATSKLLGELQPTIILILILINFFCIELQRPY